MIKKIIVLSILSFVIQQNVFAQEFVDYSQLSLSLTDVTLNPTQGVATFNSNNSDFEEFNMFLNAWEKFKQSNIRVAYEDFSSLISYADKNDFALISIATKLVDIGFFSLTEKALSKTVDKELCKNHVDSLRIFYYPKIKLTLDDEIYLADIYSDIIFNNRSKEAIIDLTKKPWLLEKYDYASYLMALGYLKSEDYKAAQKHIEIALNKNPENLNYKVLYAEILASSKRPNAALKVVEVLKNEKITDSEIDKRIKALEQYVLYKTSKQTWDKSYHLGYYYYYQNNYLKSIKTLESALGKNRIINAKIQALLSKVYLAEKEYEKAFNVAKQANFIRKNDANSLETLGDLNYIKHDYKVALKYYQKASNYSKNEYKPEVKVAKSYLVLDNKKKAQEIYAKILAKYSNCYEAYYNVAMIEPYKELSYLKKSIDINLSFIDAWLALARYEINRDNLHVAQTYLQNAKYLDKNDYRCYYYQGLLDKRRGNFDEAEYNFSKSLKLNPTSEEVKREMKL